MLFALQATAWLVQGAIRRLNSCWLTWSRVFDNCRPLAPKVWAQVPDDVLSVRCKKKCEVLLRFLSYWEFCINLEDDRTEEQTLHCLVKENVLLMKQWQNVGLVTRSDLEESLLYDCNEAAVYYVADRHVTPVLDLSVESVASEQNAGSSDWGGSSSHYDECNVSEEDRAEVIEEYQSSPRQSGTSWKDGCTPFWYSDGVCRISCDVLGSH